MGASFLPAKTVSYLVQLGLSDQASVRPHDSPLPCLACPRLNPICWDLLSWWPGPGHIGVEQLVEALGFSSTTPPLDPALRAATAYLLGILRDRIGDFFRLDTFGEVANLVRRGVIVEPPDYVLRLVEGQQRGLLDLDETELGDRPPQHIVIYAPP